MTQSEYKEYIFFILVLVAVGIATFHLIKRAYRFDDRFNTFTENSKSQ